MLTLRQVAQYLGVSQRTARRLIATHGLPAKKVGGVYRVEPNALARWLQRSGFGYVTTEDIYREIKNMEET